MAKITLEHVCVDFPIYNVQARSLKKSFMKLAGGRISEDKNNRIIVNALKDISFALSDGDRIGLIGHNGAGKSTLLRLLAQIFEPSSGDIFIEGKISPLLQVTHGFEYESTGYENIILRGIVSKLSKEEIEKSVAEIEEFSELGDYLSMPIRTYSSGMLVRLAYAISTSVKPEILLIDEIFGAGDAKFYEKARLRMISLLEESSIVVMANHSDPLIREFCNKALVLQKGELKFLGPVEEALEYYKKAG